MNKGTPTADDFERWFYGGAPPEGDDAAEAHDPSDAASHCRCQRATDALLDRLRAAVAAPSV